MRPLSNEQADHLVAEMMRYLVMNYRVRNYTNPQRDAFQLAEVILKDNGQNKYLCSQNEVLIQELKKAPTELWEKIRLYLCDRSASCHICNHRNYMHKNDGECGDKNLQGVKCSCKKWTDPPFGTKRRKS